LRLRSTFPSSSILPPKTAPSSMANSFDAKALVSGALAWAAAIPAVMLVGPKTAESSATSNKVLALALGVGISAATTPLLSYVLNWRTREEKVRGIALALGTAQVLDGIVHIAHPKFYANDAGEGLACAGNIFWGAGLLGILSCYF
jgi:hypothetical protein